MNMSYILTLNDFLERRTGFRSSLAGLHRMSIKTGLSLAVTPASLSISRCSPRSPYPFSLPCSPSCSPRALDLVLAPTPAHTWLVSLTTWTASDTPKPRTCSPRLMVWLQDSNGYQSCRTEITLLSCLTMQPVTIYIFRYFNPIGGWFFFQFRICRWKFLATMSYCRSICRIISSMETFSTLPLLRLVVEVEKVEVVEWLQRSANLANHLPARLSLHRLSLRGPDVKTVVVTPPLDSQWPQRWWVGSILTIRLVVPSLIPRIL